MKTYIKIRNHHEKEIDTGTNNTVACKTNENKAR